MATFTDRTVLAADEDLDTPNRRQPLLKHEVWPKTLVRLCILCGWRGPARRCCRCGGSTLVEEWPVRRRGR